MNVQTSIKRQQSPVRVDLALFGPLIGILISLAVWQAVAVALGPIRLPSPLSLWPQVVTDLWQNSILAFQGGGNQGLWPHLQYTIQQTLLGSAIGVVSGVVLGLLMVRSRIIRGLVEVPVDILRTIPPLAAIPFVLIWLGPTQASQLLMVSFYVAVILTVSTLNAVSNLDPVFRRFARTLGAGENHVLRTVILPAIVPELSGSVRVAVGMAWGIEVVSELLGAPMGMGQVFDKMISFQALDVIIIGIFWVTVAALVVDLLLVAGLRYLTRWHPTLH